MSVIEKAFRDANGAGRPALVVYVTVGHPTIAETPGLVQAAVDGGADVIELAVPFSDPLAEGPTIQRSSAQALKNNVTPKQCIQMCSDLRSAGITVPLVFMGYYNPILRYGMETFVRDAASAGANGLIVVDLPPEEAEPLRTACRSAGMDLIFLLAPTSTDERIEHVATVASGFIYCVSVTGVTGSRTALPSTLPDLVSRIRARTELPIAVGFGVSQREHVEALSGYADAAVVGSAVINTIEDAAPDERQDRVREFVAELGGRAQPARESERR